MTDLTAELRDALEATVGPLDILHELHGWLDDRDVRGTVRAALARLHTVPIEGLSLAAAIRAGIDAFDERKAGAQALQDHMEQHHGICLKASEWDAALRAIQIASRGGVK